ncbi:MAG: very short patch repair endonuclease [Pirellulales bacterium]|nr:very short patch repair endonuclease [Pirellulales bacterium]
MSSLRIRAPVSSSLVVRRVMQANTGRETHPERFVRRFLHRCGLRFRKDRRPVPALRCAADLVFPGARLCIFVDGCFWHGCPKHFRVPASNSAWWAEKIEANRARDHRNNAILRRDGWCVIRIWEHQVNPRFLAELESRILRRMRRTHGRQRKVNVLS